MYKVCYVEDEVNLNNVVTKYLNAAMYEVYSYNYPKEIDFSINYDLFILDIMFKNDIDGFELLKIIKEKYNDKPIIFTSARDNEIDRIRGLEMGSDDYLSKPFSPKELILRCNLILKRNNNNYIFQNNYKIDLKNHLIIDDLKTVILANKEFELIELFINNKNKVLTRQDIFLKLWNDKDISLRVVDDLIRRVRQKLPNLSLETIYGKGYQLIWKKA